MRKLLFDANAYDVVAADPQLKANIATLQEKGLLEAVYTHIEKGELSVIPVGNQIGQSEALTGRPVPTAVTIVGKSHLGQSCLAGPETSALYRKLKGSNSKHIEDAMIGTTAHKQGASLVTNDGRFRKRLARHAPDVELLDSEGLRALVDQLLSDCGHED